jgi:outer membrane lipoprotein-sorting protein
MLKSRSDSLSQPRPQLPLPFVCGSAFLFILAGALMLHAQQPTTASVVPLVDAAVKARIDNVLGYTATEHYSVFRGKDEVHPVAEMTVRTTYKRDSGKSYEILSQSGSAIMRSTVLNTILDNEKTMSQPANQKGAWITSANYDMQLKPGGPQTLNGRSVLVLDITPKRKTPYLIQGTLWVDAQDGSIVQIQGTAPKSSTVFSGPAQVTRQYANVSGYPEATHLRAASTSFMFGETIVTVDYTNYQIQLRPPS